MRTRSAVFNALLLAADLALSGAVAAGLAFLISPGLPWLVVFALLWGAYLSFTAYCLLRGASVLESKLKAFPLDLALHPKVGKVIRERRAAQYAGEPALLRTPSRGINALSLGWEDGGRLILTDGALEGLAEPEMRALITRELTRMKQGDAAIWLMYARLTITPTLFARLTGRKGYDVVNPALSRTFFFGNLTLFSVFWLGMLMAANDMGPYRAVMLIGMPSCMVIMTLLANLLISVPLLGLLRMVDWRGRELAADRAAAGASGGSEALAPVLEKAGETLLEAGTAAFDRSAWVGPIRLRKAYFVNPEAFYQVGGWNPQPALDERKGLPG